MTNKSAESNVCVSCCFPDRPMDGNRTQDDQRKQLYNDYIRLQESRVWHGDPQPPDKSQKVTESDLDKAAHVFLCSDGCSGGGGRFQPKFVAVDFYSLLESVARRNVDAALLGKCWQWFEMLCLNGLLYPWRKEFRSIKTFCGPFVYYVRGCLGSDAGSLLSKMGYSLRPDRQQYERAGRLRAEEVRHLAFEFFLARAESDIVVEIWKRTADRGVSLLDVLRERRGCRQSVQACILQLGGRRTSSRGTRTEDVVAQDGDQRDGRPAARVERAMSRGALSPISVDGEDFASEISRPTPSLLRMSSSPREHTAISVGSRTAPSDECCTHGTSDDDLDIYTASDISDGRSQSLMNYRSRDIAQVGLSLMERPVFRDRRPSADSVSHRGIASEPERRPVTAPIPSMSISRIGNEDADCIRALTTAASGRYEWYPLCNQCHKLESTCVCTQCSSVICSYCYGIAGPCSKGNSGHDYVSYSRPARSVAASRTPEPPHLPRSVAAPSSTAAKTSVGSTRVMGEAQSAAFVGSLAHAWLAVTARRWLASVAGVLTGSNAFVILHRMHS
uniref:spermatogenesis-associated protein 2-like isoform X1 n=1 Tax=Myxine glutinosa TaxID=7769 RepID=UPI00358F0E94